MIVISSDKLKLRCADECFVIDYSCSNIDKDELLKGAVIDISGIILDTREEKLETIKNKILSFLEPYEFKVIHQLPKPLKYLNSALNSNIHTRSILHGDLNMNNIIIDDMRNPWLIDFAKTRKNGHTAFDFIVLEVDIKRFILSESMENIVELLTLESALNNGTWGAIESGKCKIRDTKAFEVLVMIRGNASKYVNKEEYLLALFLYTLSTFKFKDASEKSRKFAYFSAAHLCSSLFLLAD